MRFPFVIPLFLLVFFLRLAPVDAAPPDPHVTALFHALYTGDDKKIISLLREHPVLVNARQDGQTLLSLAVYLEPNTVPLLLQYGANINARNSDGETALHQAVEDGNRPMAALLIRHGARDETNPIVDAIARGDINGLKRILDTLSPGIRKAELAGYDVNEDATTQVPGQKPERLSGIGETVTDITPLDAAIFWQRLDMIALLLATGAKIDGRNAQGWTPLHVAVSFCDLRIVRELLQDRASVNAVTNGRMAVKSPIAELLTPLHMAAEWCSADMITLLVSHGANVNVPDSMNATPLFYAVKRNDAQLVTALLNAGANPNVHENREGDTPLHQAVIYRETNDGITTPASFAILSQLLAHGANINAKDNRGLTPLALATGNNDVVAFLRRHGGKNYGHTQ